MSNNKQFLNAAGRQPILPAGILLAIAAWLAQNASNRNQANAFRHLAESQIAMLSEAFHEPTKTQNVLKQFIQYRNIETQ